MNIYTIIRTDNTGYDECIAHVVAANNESEVRKIAKKVSADEGKEPWDSATITLQAIYTGSEKKPFILLTDFRHG